jgi:hypothetical protein
VIRQDGLNQMRRLDAGQPRIQALVAEGQPLMLQAEQVQHGRVQVAHVHRILHRVVAQLVGLAVGHAAVHAAAAQEERVALDVMVAPVALAMGVRPNSPPQMISVSSSSRAA